MKIMQINAVCNIGSTGRTTIELADVLKEYGHEYFIVYSEKLKYGEHENLYRIGTPLDKKVHAFLSRLFGLQAYFSHLATYKLLKYIDRIKPEIITLRNLHGNYINLKMLLNYIAKRNIPTVAVLHDCWFYTGKCCHYTTEGCQKWQTGCYSCPKLKKDNKSWFFDRTKKVYKDKKRLFGKINNLAVIGVSDWVTNEAKKSFFKDARIVKRIYNWVHTDIFKPTESNLRDTLNLNGKFVILGVVSGWVLEKGTLDFIKLSEKLASDFKIVLVGKINAEIKLPDNIINLKETDNLAELAKYYSMADLFLNLSYQETFGKVTAEALSCGTPAIVYDTTACPELIGENCGYVVPVSDVEALYEKILKISENGKSFYSDFCIKHARENFEYKKNALEYIDLYKEMLVNKE